MLHLLHIVSAGSWLSCFVCNNVQVIFCRCSLWFGSRFTEGPNRVGVLSYLLHLMMKTKPFFENVVVLINSNNGQSKK
jgi:hypothetical protein